jgi:ABC-type Na+ efflux pump permease subunit
MSTTPTTNRQFLIAIGFIVVVGVVSFIVQTVVFELTKPIDEIHQIFTDGI